MLCKARYCQQRDFFMAPVASEAGLDRSIGLSYQLASGLGLRFAVRIRVRVRVLLKLMPAALRQGLFQ